MTKLVLPNEVLLTEVGTLLKEGKTVTMTVKGVSMLPFIVGERDSVMLVFKRDFKVGDIVLAQIRKGVYVLHRIIKINGDDIVLMGDGNIRGCEKCCTEDIFGTAVKIIKKGKMIDCCSKCHLFKASVWRILLPFRPYLLAIYRRLFL